MADETPQPQQTPPTVQPLPQQQAAVSGQSAAQQQALADYQRQAEENQRDETEPGGHYVVNETHVNAYGKPIKQGKAGKWELVNPDDRKEIGQ